MTQTKRENFSGSITTFFATLSAAVGLGNIWRFPYILGQNDIVINGLCDSVVSYCQYDCYYNVNLKGG